MAGELKNPKGPRRLLSIAQMIEGGRADAPPGIIEQPRGIRCPKCGSPSFVAKTRQGPGLTVRYRRCLLPRCGCHFTTEEK